MSCGGGRGVKSPIPHCCTCLWAMMWHLLPIVSVKGVSLACCCSNVEWVGAACPSSSLLCFWMVLTEGQPPALVLATLYPYGYAATMTVSVGIVCAGVDWVCPIQTSGLSQDNAGILNSL